tara:strand:+ start:857 stop:1375 length:519 start_codon:yes stop_codon:yes gene_type:complete
MSKYVNTETPKEEPARAPKAAAPPKEPLITTPPRRATKEHPLAQKSKPAAPAPVAPPVAPPAQPPAQAAPPQPKPTPVAPPQQQQQPTPAVAKGIAMRDNKVKIGTVRDMLLKCFASHAKGHVDKHLANVEVLLNHPAGIGGSGDIIEEIEKELDEVAKYDDLLNMVDKYLK